MLLVLVIMLRYQATMAASFNQQDCKGYDHRNLEKDTKLLSKLYGFLSAHSEPNKYKLLEKLKLPSYKLQKIILNI